MKSIRAKIMWLLFITVLLASITIGALGIFLTSDILGRSSTENMRLLCKNHADTIDIVFAKVEDSVNTLAHFAESELPNIEMLKDKTFRAEYSANIQKSALHHVESVSGAAAVYLYYDAAYIGETDGFFYSRESVADAFTYQSLTEISANPSTDGWYVPVINGKATWFEAYYDANLKRYVVSYVVPIYKEEQLVGVVGADIFTEHIVELVKEVSLFSSGQAAVLTSDGTVLYHPNFDRGVLIGEGDPGFAGVIDKLTAEDSTKELIPYQLKGEEKRLASCKLKNGMLMICFAPRAEIYFEKTMFVMATVFITAAVVFVALLFALLVSRRIARPIKRLNVAAKHLIDGEYDFNIQANTDDEVGELTKTFIEMRKILKHQFFLLDNEAHRDGLTGVGNKSAFMDREVEINKEIAAGTADFSLVVLDVNKLKIANDVFGHMVGDKLLAMVADHLRVFFGEQDIYRVGGDEFVVIIPETEERSSEELLAACIKDMKVLSVDGYPDCVVSCAYGSSRFNKHLDYQLSDVLRRADKEMYKNKSETKKDPFSWQEGSKGLKQLQVEKYSELLQSLKESTDDYLYLMNLETGRIRLFGAEKNSFAIADGRELSEGIQALLSYIHVNDHAFVKEAVASVLNRNAETIDISFRMRESDDLPMHWVNCRGNTIADESGDSFVVIGRLSRNAIKHLYNPVTTLFNKEKLKADLQDDHTVPFGCLMLLDIDNLSEMSFKHGSAYADTLLQIMAEELESRFKMQQIYHAEKGRFVVLLDNSSSKEIEGIFGKIKKAVADKFSISASVVPNDKTIYVSADNIYEYAVQILGQARKNGNGQIAFFSKDSFLERVSAAELLEELEASVRNNYEGFYPLYQPQICAEDYTMVAAETLLRFESKEKGQVYPDQFIPLLEQTGLIHDVGLWVLEQALCQCKKWRTYNPDFRISVNLSPVQLERKHVAMQILKLLAKYELPGEALILEITESSQLEASDDVVDVLTKIRRAGIQLAIDDFGTGYSNLGNLKRVGANILKVDRIFIRDIKEDSYNYNLIYNVLGFAKSNALKVYLEGVETKEELLVLNTLQADVLQGYLFDRPCLPSVLEAKYFHEGTEEYTQREDHIEWLAKERYNAPSVNMETKAILSGLEVGLWIIRVNAKTGEGELYADAIMRGLLGVDENISAQACYTHWREHIKEGYHTVVDAMVNEMANSDKVVQVEYPWEHPQRGEIIVRCSGRCAENNAENIVFKGFHRAISDLESF